MSKRIFIWVAHPKPGSLNAELAERYATGARTKRAEVRIMHLSEMAAEHGYDAGAPLSADVEAWQDNVRWADHVMIVHPYWWGAMPAQAKAVLDAGLQSGCAYKYHGRGMG